jgi:hypothetical protein
VKGRAERWVNVEGGAQSADGKARLQLEHTRGGGVGRVEPLKLRVRCRQQNVCQTPIGIGLDTFCAASVAASYWPRWKWPRLIENQGT